MTFRRARVGDVVTIDLDLQPEHGWVPEPLFDRTGRISFVLGWGNYLPGLHQLIEGLGEGDVVKNTSIDAGWGRRRRDLVFAVPRKALEEKLETTLLKEGSTLHLSSRQIAVTVLEVLPNEVILDANPPLAGSSYNCNVTVLSVESIPDECFEYHAKRPRTNLDVATFAVGCFWGGELAMVRTKGVLGTRVGFSRGTAVNPTYAQVSSGSTGHREVVQVVYDSTLVSYGDLVRIAMERMLPTSTVLSRMFDEDDSPQYQYGIYYHNNIQAGIARQCIGDKPSIEVLPTQRVYVAESYHQQYLYKRGQSTRKATRDSIQCDA